jgi:hypothetical protein
MYKRGVRRLKEKGDKKSKKGLSTIVATLLIILLTLVAVGIIWVVIKNVLQSGAEQISLGKFTLNLEIKRVIVNEAGVSIDVKIKRNAGEGELSGLKFIISDGENSEVVEINNLSLKQLEERTFNLPLISVINISRIQKVFVAPIFKLESGREIVGDVKDEYIVDSTMSSISTCIPNCAGKSCGNDYCGGVCGTCISPQTCNATYNCASPTLFCGDTLCNNGETCSSCQGDCGNCPLPAPIYLRTFYINATTGNDINNGRSPSTPWKTLININSTSSFQPGDGILFERGQVLRAQLNIWNSGNSTHPITFASYGVGADPIITGADVMSGFANGGSNIWDKTGVTTQPNVVLKSRTLQTGVSNRAAIVSEGQWYWTGNTLSIYSTSNPSGLVEAGQRQRVMDTQGKNYITFIGMVFEASNNVGSYLIYGGGGTGEYNVRYYNCTMQYSAGYGIRFGGGSHGATFGDIMDNCTVRYNWKDGIYSQYDGDVTINRCTIYSNGLSPANEFNGVFGWLGNFKITNCNIYDNGRWNILAHGIYQFLTSTPVIIDNCTIHNQPNGSGVRLRGSGTVTNSKIYNNSYSGFNLNTNDIYEGKYIINNNLIYNSGQYGIMQGGAKGTGDVTITAYHNSFFNNGVDSTIIVVPLIQNLTLKDNIFYSTNQRIIEVQTLPATYSIDYNIYYRSDANTNRWRWNSSSPTTLTAWQALGFDTHGYYNDPLYTSIAFNNLDFHLQSNSPAKWTGVNVGLVKDHEGSDYNNPTPSIGAFEYP